MELIILGSGGFQTIPRPCCLCGICVKARSKGIPYSRNGPSIFIKELKAIFDTPKDIISSINRENITKIEYIFYTHWHPDHTEGMRVVEEITTGWSYTQLFRCLYVDNAVIFYSKLDKITNARKDKPILLNGTDFV